MAREKIGVFTASLQDTGSELWVTDGTPSGTHLLIDLRSGREGSGPQDGIAAGSRVFFTADDGEHGRELWVTDGTTAGTRLLDTAAGAASGAPQDFTVVGDRLFFTADDGVHGRELWVSDGTVAGTRMVADILPGASGSAPAELAAADGRLYLRASDGVHGDEIWASDGTAAGTRLFHETQPGPGSGPAANFVGLEGGRLAYESGQPWATRLMIADADGTAVDFADLDPRAGEGRVQYAATPEGLAVTSQVLVDSGFDDQTYYSWQTWRSSFWLTDGTAEGTRYLSDLQLEPNWAPARLVTSLNGDVLFSTDKLTFRVEESPATRLGVVDTATGAASFLRDGRVDSYEASSPVGLVGAGGERLVFAALTEWGGDGMLATDGTPGETVELHRSGNGYQDVGIAGGRAFFLESGTLTDPGALWATDGTPEGTYKVRVSQEGNYIDDLVGDVGGRMLGFESHYRIGTDQLYLSDGTPDGTVALAEITYQPGYDYSNYAPPTLLGVVEVADGIRRGTPQGDTLLGQDGPDRIHGLGGDDRILAGGGADRLNGGAGADFIDGEEGDDRLYGMSGRDVLVPGSGRDIVDGGTGDDVLFAERDYEADQFFFAPGSGTDRLTAFDPMLDVIVLKGFGPEVGTAAWRAEHVTDLEGAVHVDLGGADGILVLDVTAQDLRFAIPAPSL